MMSWCLVVPILLLHVLTQLQPSESTRYSTRVEYKMLKSIPTEYQGELKPFEPIGLQYYYIGQKNFNWFQAVQECRKMGGNVINLNTDQERLLVGQQLIKNETYWLDINKLGQKEYMSIVTGKEVPYFKWLEDDVDYQTDPSTTDEPLNCVALENDDTEGFVMVKMDCMEKANFICQLASPRTVSVVVW